MYAMMTFQKVYETTWDNFSHIISILNAKLYYLYQSYDQNCSRKGGHTMSLNDKIDQVKGAVKEEVGKLTGDVKTEKEGFAEKVTAKVKEVTEGVKDTFEGTVDGVKNIVNENKDDVAEKVNNFANNVKDAVEGTIDGIKNIVNKDKE